MQEIHFDHDRPNVQTILALAAWCLSAALAFAQTNSGDGSARYAAAGQQALAAGRYAEARLTIEKLAKLEPGVAEVHATLAVIDFKLRDYELAVSEVQTAQRFKPACRDWTVCWAWRRRS